MHVHVSHTSIDLHDQSQHVTLSYASRNSYSGISIQSKVERDVL